MTPTDKAQDKYLQSGKLVVEMIGIPRNIEFLETGKWDSQDGRPDLAAQSREKSTALIPADILVSREGVLTAKAQDDKGFELASRGLNSPIWLDCRKSLIWELTMSSVNVSF